MVVAPANMENTALVDDVVAMMARQTPEILAAHTLAALVRANYTDMLPHVTRAPRFPSRRAMRIDGLPCFHPSKRWPREFRKPSPVIIQNSGHMVAMEQPEQVTSALREWLLAG